MNFASYRDRHKLTADALKWPVGQNGPVDAPLYFASAVLRDGRVFVAGGEYNVSGGASVDLLTCSIYDPVADSWTSGSDTRGLEQHWRCANPVLSPDGKVPLRKHQHASGRLATFDPVSRILAPRRATSTMPVLPRARTSFPDGTIIVAEVNNHPHAEKHLIANNQLFMPVPRLPAMIWCSTSPASPSRSVLQTPRSRRPKPSL